MIRYKEEANGIFSFPLFEPRTCRSIIRNLIPLDNWSKAQVRQRTSAGRYHSATKRDARSAYILDTDPEQAERLCRKFDEQIDTIVKPLIQHLWRIALRRHSGVQIIRYARGGHYKPHRDSSLDIQDRYFTVLCYLNDDFEGGQTWFPHLEHHTKPQSGKAVLFPARYLHCAEPVLSGEKFVMVSWILGPTPIRWIK
jgi:predicted 2-oxoglutarate/Fe(II)-dependent dioxygenase YbiX